MARREFTKEQRLAIDTRNKTLLVSAAAGSGKTATLTERIIASLLDKENPTDITSILVVTFTNAAAGELRERIAAALTGAIRDGNTELSRQLYLLPTASISTIDSFCADVLRQNAERVGISPSFRIADEAESQLLLLSVLEGLVEAIYRGERLDVATPEDFAELAAALTDTKNPAGLYEVFQFVYEKLITSEDGVKSLFPLINVYKNEQSLPPEERLYGKYIMEYLQSFAQHYHRIFTDIFETCSDFRAEEKLSEFVLSDLEFLKSLSREKTYCGARVILSEHKFPPKPRLKNEEPRLLPPYLAAREKMKEETDSILERFFSYTAGEWETLYRGLYEKLDVFYKFLSAFDEAFAEEKRRRGICRYSDVERYAYECLWQGGERTDVALSLMDKYDAIYIDEYQDVNSLQDKIFEAISRPNNRFMVGDIKQSIYGFRSARPEIFAKMKADFPETDGSSSAVGSIFMSKNFRSDKGIIDFTNAVFDKAFGTFGESIGYTDADRLTFAKTAPSGNFAPVLTVYGGEEESADQYGEDDENGKIEPQRIAEKISELIERGRLADGTAVKPSDIAIILRSVRGNGNMYKEALARVGVPAQVVESKSFFLNAEVLLALCLLNSIDNPRRDIYLAGLMRSPIFAFSADELVKIRKLSSGRTLYESLKNYTEEHPEFEKGTAFLSTLNGWRKCCEGINVHTLIAKLYNETSLLSLAARNGGKENLIFLYDLARRFEGSNFKGLYGFINYINNVINKQARFDDGAAEINEDAVKIVTVHGSKGLEYPIVFFAGTGHSISDKDAKNRVAYVENFGISMYLRSSCGLALVKNPVREVINAEAARKNFEEELRVLYVALTRAREELYVSGERSSKKSSYDAQIELWKMGLDKYSAHHLKSHLAIMLSAGIPFVDGGSNTDAEIASDASAPEPEAKPTLAADGFSDSFYETLVERFSFEYPDKHLTQIPAKLSVSSLYPAVLDGSEMTAAVLDLKTDEEDATPYEKIVPCFIGGRTRAEESALSGIATHLYLQFCDIGNLINTSASAELSRMLDEGFISEEDAKRVRLGEIEAFRASPFILRMKNAKKLWRELRFNIRLPAEDFTEDEKRKNAVSGKLILVQGVIDCIIENEDGTLSLIDYKTDRLSHEELRNKALAKAKLSRRYKSQLSYYKLAVERIFGKAPSSVEIYSLPLADTIDAL